MKYHSVSHLKEILRVRTPENLAEGKSAKGLLSHGQLMQIIR